MAFRAANSEIRNPDGSIVFQLKGIDVPADWSQVAADVLAQKYFRRAGVPARLVKIAEHDVPEWLWRSAPDQAALAELPDEARYGGEHECPPGLPPHGRRLDLLGMEGRLLRQRGRRSHLL